MNIKEIKKKIVLWICKAFKCEQAFNDAYHEESKTSYNSKNNKKEKFSYYQTKDILNYIFKGANIKSLNGTLKDKDICNEPILRKYTIINLHTLQRIVREFIKNSLPKIEKQKTKQGFFVFKLSINQLDLIKEYIIRNYCYANIDLDSILLDISNECKSYSYADIAMKAFPKFKNSKYLSADVCQTLRQHIVKEWNIPSFKKEYNRLYFNLNQKQVDVLVKELQNTFYLKSGMKHRAPDLFRIPPCVQLPPNQYTYLDIVKKAFPRNNIDSCEQYNQCSVQLNKFIKIFLPNLKSFKKQGCSEYYPERFYKVYDLSDKQLKTIIDFIQDNFYFNKNENKIKNKGRSLLERRQCV